ncbi:MAG TPA: site-specific DNA-methyltransferase, partial [bacterium]|nr:site-specific DNA-methyltransferase [bacterium]
MIYKYPLNFQQVVNDLEKDSHNEPLFISGEALLVLKSFPDSVIDMAMTSPPYWGKRDYQNDGIGLEADPIQFIDNLLNVFNELKRVLKPTGSFWLNIGDTYRNKSLLGLPWRIAIRMIDEQGWIMRNSVIWNKLKGSMDNSPDRLANVHENLFHFVKSKHDYFYDTNAIRKKPKNVIIKNGSIISATGVSGVRYRRQIELSSELSEAEKKNAIEDLDVMMNQIRLGELSDFRMVIRGHQRATHSDAESISGRARELKQKGYYFLKYHPNGSKPADVWDIIPEDSQKRKIHYAPYPEDLCRIPIAATCPPNGIVLDPFCGTGTTMAVAKKMNRKSIGVDFSSDYIQYANKRCEVWQ